MKSEPDVFSIEHLKKKRVAGWDGVRNFQARNFLRAMQKCDEVFFYHSSTEPPAVVGLMTVAKTAYPDPSQFDRKSEYYDGRSRRENPRWFQVDVRFGRIFSQAVPLSILRQQPGLSKMVLLRRSRLSVSPVEPKEWYLIRKLAGDAD